MNSTDRYVNLDALRGLAAILVALFHFDLRFAAHGYLAVDFFFVLSGFVLSKAYVPRFKSGLGTKEFMVRRFIRLYPLFFVGLAIGFFFLLQGTIRQSNQHLETMPLLLSLLPNVLMLPYPFERVLFPINAPAWSLFLEIVANLVLAIGAWRLGSKSLLLVVAISAIGMCLGAYAFQSTDAGRLLIDQNVSTMASGAAWSEFGVGLLRTIFSFSSGMLIASVEPTDRLRRARFWLIPSLAILAALLIVPVPKDYLLGYDLVVAIVASPTLILLASRSEPLPRLVPMATLLGELSFALYAVHMPISHAFQWAARALHLSLEVLAPFYVLTALTISWLAVRFVDIPLRQYLTAKWKARNYGSIPLNS
ncbi:MAG: acyltransferase [Novosphingobium sp.]|uniref:acyltransferase family protein n=1 Tax=Novosphingobium sp. TaxID=1874826 RepID=UPI003C7BDA9D